MLGDKLGQVTVKVVLRRVLAAGPSGTKTESTQQGNGNLLGVDFREMSTYTSELRPDGTLFGSGQGIYMGTGGETSDVERLRRRHVASIKEHLVPKASVEQMQDGVLRSTDIEIDRQPIFRFLGRAKRLLVSRIEIAQVIPA